MGRPADKFCKHNIEELEGKGKWRCRHCKLEFSGSASRIRNHLAGQSTDIRQCEAVPSSVREEALQEISKKRGRSSSSGPGEVNNDGIGSANIRSEGEAAFQVPSSNVVELITNTAKDREQECTIDALLKFFMSQNISVDAIEDPHLRTLLMRVAQHGFPSCILRNDSVYIQKSLWNCEHEVNTYMLMVMESWKTTGCTLISYNLNQGKGNSLDLRKESLVYGFYCPKGFIFVEGRQLDFSQGFKNAFEKHILKLPMKNVTHEVHHSGHPGCEFAPGENNCYYGTEFEIPCVRQRFEELWMGMSREIGWVRNLIHKSEKVYHYLLHSPNSYKFNGWRELMVEKDATTFTHLKSIMQLKDEMVAWRSNHLKYDLTLILKEHGVDEIINNNEFWCEGNELLNALTPLMEIIDVVDTLVPTAGYLQPLLEKAKSRLKIYYEREASKYQLIWRSVYVSTLELELSEGLIMCPFLSPVCDWQEEEEEVLFIKSRQKKMTTFGRRLMEMEGEKQKLDAEMKIYKENSPFANLPNWECRGIHPVNLWNKYGSKFPVLKKWVVNFMSQPTSCMCNQVKKHIKHFEGEDNFILRLNYHMMHHFTQLGDQIYKPLDVELAIATARIPKQISPDKMVEGPHIGL